MASQYEYLPISVPSFLREVVAMVSKNLKYELTESLEGMEVQFKHGSWMEVERQLLEDTQSVDKRNIKYPLIIAIHPIDEKIDKSRNVNLVNVDMLIVTDVEPNTPIDERELNSYKNILYPIYAEFLEQLWKHRLISDTGYRRSHTKRDLYHLGQTSAVGNTKYQLPDALDGLSMQDLVFPLNLTNVYEEDYVGCQDTVCSSGRMIELMNAINSVDFKMDGNGSLQGIINSATLTNNSATQTAVVYIVDDGNGGSQTVDVGTWFTIDLSAFADGNYVGTITSSYGATIQFGYTLQHGLTKYSTGARMLFSANYDCSLYPNYTADFDSSVQFIGYTVSSWYFQVDGIPVDSNLAASGSTVHVVGSDSISNTQRVFESFVVLSNGMELYSQCNIKLKCI